MIKISYTGRTLFDVEVHGETFALYYNYSLFIQNKFAKTITNIRDVINNHDVRIEADSTDLPEELLPFYKRNSNATNESVEIFGIIPLIGLADSNNSAVTPQRVGDTRVLPYSNLTNKPSINGVELSAGNNSAEKLGLVLHTDSGKGLMQGGEGLTDFNFTEADRAKLDTLTTETLSNINANGNRIAVLESKTDVIENNVSLLDDRKVEKSYIYSSDQPDYVLTSKGKLAAKYGDKWCYVTSGYINPNDVLAEDDSLRYKVLSDNNYTDADRVLVENATRAMSLLSDKISLYTTKVNGVVAKDNEIIITAKDINLSEDDITSIFDAINNLDETVNSLSDELSDTKSIAITSIKDDDELYHPMLRIKDPENGSAESERTLEIYARRGVDGEEILLDSTLLPATLKSVTIGKMDATATDSETGRPVYLLPIQFTRLGGDISTVYIKVPRSINSDTITVSNDGTFNAVVATAGNKGIVGIKTDGSISIDENGFIDVRPDFLNELSELISSNYDSLSSGKLDVVWKDEDFAETQHEFSVKNRILITSPTGKTTLDEHINTNDIDKLKDIGSIHSILGDSTLNSYLANKDAEITGIKSDVAEKYAEVISSINNEVTNRTEADTNISERITANTSAIETEVSNRESAITNLSNELTGFIQENRTAIESEVTNRETAVNTEKNDRIQAINDLRDEINETISGGNSAIDSAMVKSVNGKTGNTVVISGSDITTETSSGELISEAISSIRTGVTDHEARLDILEGDIDTNGSVLHDAQNARYDYTDERGRNVQTTIKEGLDDLRGDALDPTRTTFSSTETTNTFKYVTKEMESDANGSIPGAFNFNLPVVKATYVENNKSELKEGAQAGIISAWDYAYIRDKCDHTITSINGIETNSENSITLYGNDITRSSSDNRTLTQSLSDDESRISTLETEVVKSVNGINATNNNVIVTGTDIKIEANSNLTIPEAIDSTRSDLEDIITDNKTDIEGKLADEAQARSDADDAITASISNEVTDRTNADNDIISALNVEKQERINQDTVINTALVTKVDKSTYDADKTAHDTEYESYKSNVESRLGTLDSYFTDGKANSAIVDSEGRNIANGLDSKLDKSEFNSTMSSVVESVNGNTVDAGTHNVTISASDINMSSGESVDTKVLDNVSRIETVESYFNNGIAKQAICDASNRDIVATYITKTDATEEIASAVLIETNRAKAEEQAEHDRAVAREDEIESNLNTEISNRLANEDSIRSEIRNTYVKKETYDADKLATDGRLDVIEACFTDGKANTAIADDKGRSISRELDAKVFTTTFDDTIARIDADKDTVDSISNKVYNEAKDGIYSVDDQGIVTSIAQAILANTEAIKANNRGQFKKVPSINDIPLTEDSLGKIFLVPKGNDPDGEAGVKDEFIVINSGTESDPNYEIEEIGDTDIDLTDYAKMDWVHSISGAVEGIYKVTEDNGEVVTTTIKQALNYLYGQRDDHTSRIVTLESYFSNGIANSAITDKNGNDIFDTYATVAELTVTNDALSDLTDRVDSVEGFDTDVSDRLQSLEDTRVTIEQHDLDIQNLEDTKLPNHYDPTIKESASEDAPPRYTNRVLVTDNDGNVTPSLTITTRELSVLNGIDAFGDNWTLASFVRGVPEAVTQTFGHMFKVVEARSDAIELGTDEVGITLYDKYRVLTDNNFSDAEKTKLAGIEAGAKVNVQANWNESDNTSDSYIQNKPELAAVATSGSASDVAYGNTTVSSALTALEQGNSTASTDIAALQGRATALESNQTALSTTTTDLDTRVIALETTIATQATTISTLQANLANALARIAALETAVNP